LERAGEDAGGPRGARLPPAYRLREEGAARRRTVGKQCDTALREINRSMRACRITLTSLIPGELFRERNSG